jgi:hypothetical protein
MFIPEVIVNKIKQVNNHCKAKLFTVITKNDLEKYRSTFLMTQLKENI